MEDVFVGSLMSSPVHSMGPSESLRDAGRVLLDNDIGSVVVIDDGDLVGILTATDFVRVVADGEAEGMDISSAMSREVVTTTANKSVATAVDLMVETAHCHLPVVDGGDVIGMVTTTDLAAYVSTAVEPTPPQ